MSQRTIVILSGCLFILTLLWGTYSLIMYLGIPIHQLVYLQQSDIRSFDVACGADMSTRTLICRGAMAVVPFVQSLFMMGSPFLSYVIVCLVLAGAVLLWAGYRTGYFSARLTIRPWYLVAAFVLSVWLMGTMLSLGTLNNLNTPPEAMLTNSDGTKANPPFRRFYEPVPQVYGGAGTQALAALDANYQSLQERGCLKEDGITQNGAKLFTMSEWCVQTSMFTRVGSQLFLVGFLLFALLVLGRFLLKTVLRTADAHPLLECCLALGIGALGWVAILWSLAIAGLLQQTLIRALFFGSPLLLFWHSWYWIKAGWQRRFEFELSFSSAFPLLVWLLISYLALNFLNVVRPFPIGWDDLGSYLNRPRLLSSYGAFIPSMSQFQWEYLTSLGYLLFGYDSWIGSTFAMQINWMAGLISVLIVYAFGRLFFGKKGGVLSAMLYYFLPMTGHFSFADMKVDNASFFTSALAVLAVCIFLFRPHGEEEGDDGRRDMRLLFVTGLLAGFSFGIKPTAILSIFMILSIITGATLGPLGFGGMSVLTFAILQKWGPLSVADISNRALLGITLPQSFFMWVCVLIGIGLLAGGAYRQRALLRLTAAQLGLFLLGAAMAVLPWGMYNMSTSRNISPAGMLTAQDFTSPQVSYNQPPEVTDPTERTVPTRYLPAELKLDPANPACKTSARTEELDRYWGFSRGLGHYLTLPWRQVMNIDAFGYYVTLVPALLLLPLLLLVPFFWMRKARWLRMVFAASFVFLIQWALVANGIPWYGIGMFLGFVIILEAFIVYAPDAPNRFLYAALIIASILVCLVNRLWQFDSQKNLFEYPLGKISAEALREVTIPDYDDIREAVVSRHEQMPDTPYTYRVGTFISYFIPRNREIFPLADHQMQFFNCINQERDHALTLRRLKALGFNSIIFDTNTQTIEKDPNGSLHQKVSAFLDFANDPVLKLNLMVNDPGNGIAYILLP